MYQKYYKPFILFIMIAIGMYQMYMCVNYNYLEL